MDADLQQLPGLSLDQQMELSGLAVAQGVYDTYENASSILAIIGPGNNGGDTLIACRHLKHFGKDIVVVYPKRVNKDIFHNLVAQMEQLEIPIFDSLPDDFDSKFDLILDGIFGNSFDPYVGEIREPFATIIEVLVNCNVPIVSVDIPSGWHIEEGDSELSKTRSCLQPDCLISLNAPKVGTKYFKGRFHLLGGRFIPPALIDKYNLQDMPKYSGTNQYVVLNWSDESK